MKKRRLGITPETALFCVMPMARQWIRTEHRDAKVRILQKRRVIMRRWNCGRGVGICALALGVGILIAAIFPVGCLMFIVAFLLIACGLCCLRQ